MASNFLRSPTTLIIILCAMSSVAIAYVLDTDGEPILNGGQYYIVPQNIGIGGGLSLTSKKGNESPCPFYITRDRDKTSPGIPVRITSPFRIAFIAPSFPIAIAFKDSPDTCMQPLGWQVVPDSSGRSYVATGGVGKFFGIDKVGEENNVYKIYVKNKIDVGIFNNDGLLGINADIPLFVVFKKAHDNVLAMKV